jgi:hypothetical protein
MEDLDKLPSPPIFVTKTPADGSAVNTTYAQDQILKALSEGITDPKELAKLASLKKTADVYTVLDKLSLRKEFHAALDRANLSLDFIVRRLKTICENPDDEVAIKGLSTVLKTIGLDKADDAAVQGQAWEDVVLANASLETEEVAPGKYVVIQPAMPESLRKSKDAAKEAGKELYKP